MTRFILRSTMIAMGAIGWIVGCSSAETESATSNAEPLAIGCAPGQTQSCQYDSRFKTTICTSCANHLTICPNLLTVNVNNVCVPCGFDGAHQCLWGCDAPLTVGDGLCRPCDADSSPSCKDIVGSPFGNDGGIVGDGNSWRVCADDPTYGLTVIDREWDPTMCGNPSSPTTNVLRLRVPPH